MQPQARRGKKGKTNGRGKRKMVAVLYGRNKKGRSGLSPRVGSKEQKSRGRDAKRGEKAEH